MFLHTLWNTCLEGTSRGSKSFKVLELLRWCFNLVKVEFQCGCTVLHSAEMAHLNVMSVLVLVAVVGVSGAPHCFSSCLCSVKLYSSSFIRADTEKLRMTCFSWQIWTIIAQFSHYCVFKSSSLIFLYTPEDEDEQKRIIWYSKIFQYSVFIGGSKTTYTALECVDAVLDKSMIAIWFYLFIYIMSL